MFKVIFLKSENELNKLLKSQRRTGEALDLLFVATWDKWCNELVASAALAHDDEGKPLYIINSFAMPHAFVIFNTTKLPHLIRLGKHGIKSEDYLPRIYKILGS